MEQDFEKNIFGSHCQQMKQWTGPNEKIPMHPDDFNALLAWITAKRFHETGDEKSCTERPVYSHFLG